MTAVANGEARAVLKGDSRQEAGKPVGFQLTRWATAAVMVLLFTGCTTVEKSIKSVAENLPKDNATFIVTSPQFGQLIRTNPRDTQDVTINPNGSVTITGHGNSTNSTGAAANKTVKGGL